MSLVQRYLQSINNEPASSGKVFAQWPGDCDRGLDGTSSATPVHPEFRYVLLNSAVDFQSIIEEA
jgi:hypothetical protein